MSNQVRQWEDQVRLMKAEWQEIGRQETAGDLARWEAQVAEWETQVADMSAEYQRLVSEGLWVSGPADFLSIIGREVDERTHSQMLAWLLRPTGRHGLRNLLLRSLLTYYDSKHGGADADTVVDGLYSVDCPCWRKGREADVVVWGKGFTLVIEMKVNAGESSTQCDDMYENFKGEKGARFLFLTRDGTEPATATTSEAKRAFRAISWPEVRRMIEAALKEPVSQRGAAAPLVENYVITLKEHFG